MPGPEDENTNGRSDGDLDEAVTPGAPVHDAAGDGSGRTDTADARDAGDGAE